MRPENFADTTPKLVIEDYFGGKTRGYGLVEDRWGNVRRQFVVDMEGSPEGGAFVLREWFVFDDGEKQERVWQIRRVGEHEYEATADDIEGVNKGRAFGQAMNWNYTLLVPFGSRRVGLAMDDWMFLKTDDVLINKVDMSKFGIGLGRITITFRKLPN